MQKRKNSKPNIKGRPFDFILVTCVFIMLSLGIIMVLSASYPSSLAEGTGGYAYVKTQALSAIIGLVLMFMISKIDYRIYKNFYKVAYWASVILLLTVLIPGLGKSARRCNKMDYT
ncbi:MAG: FtsW/RodA/SpoVE family cell cycle protein [Clostridia bacterium]|nr:FtsW/RodA/SpoVE family cell cycle protein [Clostridia bacterium]